MPLSCQGLCEAEITMPAENSWVWVRKAMPGVVMTPTHSTCTPDSARPPASTAAIQKLDSRVSWPMTTRPGRKMMTDSAANGKDGCAVEGILAGNAADSVRAKKFSQARSSRLFITRADFLSTAAAARRILDSVTTQAQSLSLRLRGCPETRELIYGR